MKKIGFSLIAISLFLCSLFPLSLNRAEAGALVRSAITGRVIAKSYYHGRFVRMTVRRLSGIQSQRYVVIRSNTKVYYKGREGENPQSPAIIRRGMVVRAEGGLTTFGDRIVADKIVLLKW